MRIGIDCSPIAGQRTGIGQYAYNLVESLIKLDKKNEYVLYPFFYFICDPDYKNADIPQSSNFRVAFRNIPLPKVFRYIWLAGIPSFFKQFLFNDVDIVHSTTFSAPKFRDKNKKLVVTIYDLTVLTHPECHKKENIQSCIKGIKDSLKYASAILAISEHTKKDLINYLNTPEELITVTPLAADPIYRPVKDPEVLRNVNKKYKLPSKYILFIGSLEPRKNVKSLITAYSRLSADLKREYSLVIAGAKGWLNSEIFKMVSELEVNGIHFTGYLDREDINAVYSQAAVFVYPSLYEGFGLPILEAMACGAPVITSNTSSMPEVAGDAARLITPTDVDELTEVLTQVLRNENLRSEMSARGIKRAAEFSWDDCARKTLAIYKKVGNRRS